MGYDQRQPNSSGTLVAVIGVGLVLAILGLLVVGGAALFWLQTARLEVDREQSVAELRRVGVEAHNADVEAQRKAEEARVEATPELNFAVSLDREGNISVDDEMLGLDELKRRVAEAKGESSSEFLARIIADPGCPKRHIKSVVAVFDEVGGVAWFIVSPENADAPPGELNNVAN